MGFGSSLSRAIRHVAAPVFSLPAKAIQSATGLSAKEQLGIGAGIGAGAGIARAFGGGAAGAVDGGVPGVAGVSAGASGSSGFGAFMGRLGSNVPWGSLVGAAGNYFAADQMADAQRDANSANVGLAREQMAFSAAQAERQMAFQEKMAGTSYQRGIEDMKKAGLNPMLAYSQGGAASPGGASGSPAGAKIEAVPSVLANVVSSALDMARTFASVRRDLATADAAAASTSIKKEDAEGARLHGRIYRMLNRVFDRVGGGLNSAKEWFLKEKYRSFDPEKAVDEMFEDVDSQWRPLTLGGGE